MKTALVFGATGQTGALLTDELLKSPLYNEVKIFVRKPSGKMHPKLRELVNPLKDPEYLKNEIKGDDVFCCIGTTIRKAGTKAIFRQVDYELPVSIARIAQQNGINSIITVSAMGANVRSNNFYLRTKGEMEHAVAGFGIENTVFVRPSLLLGKRDEHRTGELIGKWVMLLLNPLFIGRLKRYKAIPSSVVAKAMIHAANDGKTGTRFIENEELVTPGK
ncbi:MAG TPA: NAD(P)H-binding protein [Bacteroidia bacterium]|nr:NAD(P)H-binding protein [Bacteroidia bacterium]